MQTDSPWKEILDEYFPDFTELLFPTLYAVVDWSRGFTPLDKELVSLEPRPARKRGGCKGTLVVDKLMRVYGHGGKHMLILVHVEIQAQHQAKFARRMYEYHSRIVGKHRARVVSMAVLADGDPTWRPSSYEDELGGCKELLEFPIAKLIDFRGRNEELESSTNRFAIAVFAYLKAQESEGNAELIFFWKLELTKRLSTRGPKEQAQLLQFFDYIFLLSSELDEYFWETLKATEEVKYMAYVTSLERISIKKGRKQGLEQGKQQGLEQGKQQGLEQGKQQGLEQGKQQGLEQGKQQGLEQGRLDQARDLVLEALEVRFGEIEDTIAQKVHEVEGVDVLSNLLRKAITAGSLAEFAKTFDAVGTGE